MQDHEDAERDNDAERNDDAGGPSPQSGGSGGESSGDARDASAQDDAGPEGARADDGEQASPEGDSDRLSEEIREELEELDELRDRHLRLAAEFENYRKRTRREMKEAREKGRAELAGRLLEPLDDLQRVMETSADATTIEALQEGVEMVQRKMEKELSEAGLARMEPEGERFDPEFHEALLTVPTDDPRENDVVSRVLINGYLFGERVLRPARVEVKKYSPPEGEAEDGDTREEGEGGEEGEAADEDGEG